jgi:hypothetical protein
MLNSNIPERKVASNLVVTHLKDFYARDILLGMAKVQLWGYRCERCAHEWLPRQKDEEPRVCPKCKSPYWNRPRKDEKQVRLDRMHASPVVDPPHGGDDGRKPAEEGSDTPDP